MKTFCIFSANYLPNLGGVERYTYNLAMKLSAMGQRVIIVTSNVFGLDDVGFADNIKIYRMPCINLLDGRFPVLKINSKYIGLKKKLYTENIDYVLVNTRFYTHSLFGLRFAKKIRAKTIVVEHGSSHFTIGRPIWDSLGHLYEHFITSLLKRHVKVFYGVSKACNQWLKHFKIEASGVFYNFVDLNEIKRLKEEPVLDFRKTYDIASDEIIVSYSGRLVQEKGVMELIKTVLLLKQSGLSVRLFIAGEGSMRNELEIYDSEKIILLGQIGFSRIIALLDQTDIFCLPSYAEGFPTSIIEAAACECFCIAGKQGGAKELILDDSYGIILDKINLDTISDAILLAATDAVYRKDAAKRVKQRVEELFHLDATAKNIMETFQVM